MLGDKKKGKVAVIQDSSWHRIEHLLQKKSCVIYAQFL